MQINDEPPVEVSCCQSTRDNTEQILIDFTGSLVGLYLVISRLGNVF